MDLTLPTPLFKKEREYLRNFFSLLLQKGGKKKS
jgi:hypothetical protein